jgi:hypothetical protein
MRSVSEMRHILVDYARRHRTERRGGAPILQIEGIGIATSYNPDQIVDIDRVTTSSEISPTAILATTSF